MQNNVYTDFKLFTSVLRKDLIDLLLSTGDAVVFAMLNHWQM